MNIDYEIRHVYGSANIDSWITKEGIAMCRTTVYDRFGNIIECLQAPTGIIAKMSGLEEPKPKKKISWLRIVVSVNCIVNGYIIWCINDLYKLNYDLGSALVFMAKIFDYVYRLKAGGIHI